MKISYKNTFIDRIIPPGFIESFILGLFLLGTACLETGNVFSTLNIYNDPTVLSRKMVETGGYLYIANKKLHIIEQVNISTGIKLVWAGSSGLAGGTDGTLTNARFNAPSGITYRAGASPKLYVIETTGCTLREIDINTQTVTTIAGTTGICGSVNAVGTAARFSGSSDVVLTGTNLYISDYLCIRKVDLTNYQVTTPIGNCISSGFTNATGTSALFSGINSFTIIGSVLFIADYYNNVIRAADINTLVVTTFSGSGALGFVDGTSGAAQFNRITSITSDGSATLFATDFNNNAIRQIDATTGGVTTIIGGNTINQDISGAITSAKLTEPLGITLSNYGLFFANMSNVRRLH